MAEEIIILRVQADLKQPVQSFSELDKRVKLLRKTLKGSPREGTKAFEDLAKTISSRTGVSIEQARKQILDFQKTATSEIKKGSAALKEFNSELREIPANANSIQALRNQVKKLDKEVSQLDTTTQEFVDKSQELKKTRDRLKELEKSTGDARRSVGGYEEAITRALRRNLQFGKGLQGIQRAFKVAFGLASLRTAISTLGSLYDTIIEKNAESEERFQELQAATSGVRESFINLASKGLAFIARPLTNFINAIAFTFDKVQELAGGNTFLGRTFQFVGRVISGVLNALGNFPAFFAGIIAGARQVASNVRASFERLGVNVQILAQKINRFNPFSSQTSEEIEVNIASLEARLQSLTDSQRTVSEAFREAFDSTKAQQQAYKQQNEEAAKANEENQKTVTLLQALSNRQKSLEEQIKNRIASGRDFSKQQEELRKVTERLTGVEEKFAEATRFSETELQNLQRRQQEVTEAIKERIASGEAPLAEQLQELTSVTKELTGVNEEFEDINNKIKDSLTIIAEGSAKDYEQRLEALRDQQQDLNIKSEEYANIQAKINLLENERATILDLINTNVSELNQNQEKLNEQISDSEAQKEALQSALSRIKQVTDATEEGAEKIKGIEEDLSAAIEQIEFDRLVRSAQNIDQELQNLELAKQKELEIVKGNADLEAAVEAKFSEDKKQLELERLQVSTNILNKQIQLEKSKQKESIDNLKESEQQKQKILQATVSFIGQASDKVIQIISNLQEQAFEKQLEQLNQQEEAAVRSAEAIGKSEASIQATREQFEKRREELEKKQAEKRKLIAITQAIIQTALAVATALGSSPPPANFVQAALVGALGAIQIGVISSQKFALGDIFDIGIQTGTSKFAKGAYLKNGAYHSEGGMPILNPYTGQKVAEIEKGEAIINRRTIASKDQLTLSGTPYDIASQLNSYKGFGVAFPKARRFSKGAIFNRGGYSKVAPKKVSYGFGGRFGVSSNVLKLQTGAIVAASATRQIQRVEGNSSTNRLLQELVDNTNILIEINSEGFGAATSTTDDLEKIAQLQRDFDNAS